jgi:Ca-activated chloride channel family protein
MTSRILPASLSLLFALAAARAETAADFFHGGAMNYFSNNIPQALTVVTNGRAQFPDDEKLKKLEELLKKQQDQQQQDQKDQQEKKDQQDKKDEQTKEQDKQDQQQKQDQKKQDDKSKQGQQQQAQAKAGQMTPEQARRLLDAQKGNESALVLRPPEKPKDESKPVKDW